MPFFVKQATMDQIEAEIARLNKFVTDIGRIVCAGWPDFEEKDVLPQAQKIAADLKTANENNVAFEKENKRLTDGWRATSDEKEAIRKQLAATELAVAAHQKELASVREELAEARDTIKAHLATISRANAAEGRALAAHEAEKAAHAKTRENAASDVQGLKATHADILKTERTQVFNLNELVAKLNREATETKAAHEKALASLRDDMELLKLSHADAMLAAQERRLADVATARSASDDEVAAARKMMDDVRAQFATKGA